MPVLFVFYHYMVIRSNIFSHSNEMKTAVWTKPFPNASRAATKFTPRKRSWWIICCFKHRSIALEIWHWKSVSQPRGRRTWIKTKGAHLVSFSLSLSPCCKVLMANDGWFRPFWETLGHSAQMLKKKNETVALFPQREQVLRSDFHLSLKICCFIKTNLEVLVFIYQNWETPSTGHHYSSIHFFKFSTSFDWSVHDLHLAKGPCRNPGHPTTSQSR